ncbi:transporter substrate-binding domain-containing protein [Defluviimonas sp. WL0002]|uniref:Transporter substrate-binding domain-containing protein n=1 Tax=Albidovulum marisflavi TaxID=2984159 RepID=A0ABT2Z8Q2_9RHOB|nr:transporter substrate-binding domain-containing protein [Defluviimonas sp. WL0002]MCV2867486.1 transporter substrate-binding domain-containing protein [Defluviimonas sp. WL0002]
MKRLMGAAAAIAMVAAFSTAAQADKLDDIKAAGKIVVGVKQDYKPWGYLTSDGELTGLEIDLAKDVASRLGVEAELVPVVASNRMEFLQQGRIDLIIATMGDNPERREVVGMIEPNYYAGGTNVIAPKAAGLKEWEDIRGKDVCALQGSYYNKRVTQLYGPNLVAFAGIPEATSALTNGSCVAFLYDNTWIESQLASDPQWADYEMPFVTEDPQAWSIAVPLEDLDQPYGQLMSEIVTDWHKTGYLIERNAANGIAPSPFLQEQHDKLQ